MLSPKLKDKGRWAEVPRGLYGALEQGAVITEHGAHNPAAEGYLEFLKSAAAREVFEANGYGLPAAP